ncbi:hypothetical protein [Streptomyces flavalbus]|uniref:Uncharacterized protein n=1 Tax=Streptomyces flavalbus TaxID=2665155 RepID=A0ABW2W8R1_9ACTN
MPQPGAAGAPRRRRGRTALLLATAAVLGAVAGTCVGYLVQADRAPTKLPSLSQPVLPQAKGPAPEPLSAARDRRVRTDGDLRKLLLDRPRGAREGDWAGEDGWMELPEYAATYEQPDGAFDNSIEAEFRRAAVATWEQGDSTVEIRLVQYRQEQDLGAREDIENLVYWADQDEDAESWPIPGTGNDVGLAYADTAPTSEPGYLPYWEARAFAWRGDIAVQIWVADSKRIPKAKIMDLAKRQLERL